MNPAEFGKLAARHNLVEIAEASRRGSGRCGRLVDMARRLVAMHAVTSSVVTSSVVGSSTRSSRRYGLHAVTSSLCGSARSSLCMRSARRYVARSGHLVDAVGRSPRRCGRLVVLWTACGRWGRLALVTSSMRSPGVASVTVATR